MNKLHKQIAPFTQVPNELLRDPTISLKAKGMYALMYSKPDGWMFYESAIVAESRDGKDAVGSAIDELIAAGWLTRKGGREDGTGRFTAFDYEIKATRSGLPVAENPRRENRSGKPATINTDIINTDEVILTHNPLAPKGEWGGFDEFWKSYPYKVGKPNALKSWNAKKPILAEVLEGVERWKGSKAWKKDGGQFIPHPSTFLNQERWKDMPEVEKPQRPQGASPFFIPYGG